MAKNVVAVVKIQLEAGGATPAPPVGTALGPHGVQTMEFCKQYNAATESMRGTVIPVEISIYEDRTFTFVLKTPPTPVLLRQAAGIAKGAQARRPRDRGHGHDGPGRRDRQDQAEGPQHRRPRDGQAPGGRHCSLDGHHGRGLGENMKHGKNYKNALAQVDREELLTVPEAIDKVKSLVDAPSSTRPSSSPCASGVDPRKAEQIVRGTISLPAGTGKTNRVAVFAAGEAAQAARDAGADDRRRRGPGGEGRRRVPRLRRGDRDAGPDGPGRWTRSGARTARTHAEPQDGHRHHRRRQGRHRVQGRARRVPHRQDRQRAAARGQGQLLAARTSCGTSVAVIDELVRVKPASAKGRYLMSVTVSSTMGPGVKIDPTRMHDHDEALASA